ncbi:helix-turn-helix transcriptional regulator [Caballeronia sp. AZ10_KS36]|uniref:helix-turn-helix transcriptional regulator n=1 Tax=Caballeronia sp. AZ10_KS36 TaxID=2921757 RepID=UPI002028952C|nr:helix-turn-helix transcriptional regulator [Caballeronia sp. AZ10_KS36]
MIETRIRRRRHELKISMISMAQKIGVSRRHLIRIENGERPASVELAKKIGRALGVPVRYLFAPFALDKRMALPAFPADRAPQNAGEDEEGRSVWALEISLRDKSMVRFEAPEGAEHERIIGKFTEQAKAGKDRNPFVHVDAGRYLVFVNMDHVEVATFSHESIDVPDTQDEEDARQNDDATKDDDASPEGPNYEPTFHKMPEQDGWAVMSSGYKETPLMLANEDPSAVVAPMDAARTRNAFLRFAETWTAGGRITLTNGSEMSSYLVDATVLLYVPLNSDFVPK